MAKAFKRGSSRVNVKESTLRKLETKEVRDIVTFEEKKRSFGRYQASFRNEDGHFQYLIAYNPTLGASLQIVRPVLEEPTLPTAIPTKQGEIIELKMYYRDEETGEVMVKTYDVVRDGYKSCYDRWMTQWDRLIEDG